MTAAEARARYRELAKSAEVRAYIYIVTDSNKLLGVMDVKELLTAEENDVLKNLTTEQAIRLEPQSTMKQAEETFLRYGFRALHCWSQGQGR